MRSVLRVLGASALVMAGLISTVALASALGMYAAGSSSGGPSSFYRLDGSSGAATLVGAIGFDRVSAMDANPFTQELYACAQRPVSGVPVLIRIDLASGFGTEIGPLGTPSGAISDMSFRPSDGKLFAHFATGGSHALYTIDTSTGAATLVGPTLVGGGGNSLEFTVDNVLLLHASTGVFRLDQNTGAATFLNAMSYAPAPAGFVRPTATDVHFDGSEFATLIRTDTGNVLYGRLNPMAGSCLIIGDTGSPDLDAIALVSRPTGWATTGSGGGASDLYRIDLVSGAPTHVGPIGFDHVGAVEEDPLGFLWGAGNRAGTSTPVLITIDPVTGKGTEVGLTGIDQEISDLAWRGSTLYAYDAFNNPYHSLATLDRNTGAGTILGSTGIGSQSGNAMAVSPSGITIWHASTAGLHTLNPVTGAATLQGPITFAPPMNTGNARPPAMDYFWNGVLYSLIYEPSVPRCDLANFDFFTMSFKQRADIGVTGLDGFAARINQNPQARLIAPNGGETFFPGSTQTVFWDTFNDPTIRSVNLALSTTVDLVASSGGAGSGTGLVYTLDTGTGAATYNGGTIGFDNVGALAMHPVTGQLYGCAQRSGTGVPVLITILPSTGVAWEVGPTGIPSGKVSDLAFRPSDNTLFAYDPDASDHKLWTINIETGKATLVGSTGLSGNGGNGIAFAPNGTLYHVNRTDLNTLDPATGLATPVAPMSWPAPLTSFARASALDFDPASGGMYALVKDSGLAYLCTIDPASAAVTLIGNTGQGALDGAAFVFGPPSTIAAAEPNDGSFTWTVPNTPTKVARLLVTVYDDANQGEVDFSNGFFEIQSAVAVGDGARPLGTSLAALAPNPFRGEAPIRFTLASPGEVRLTVHDVRGALVRTLASGRLPAGEQVVRWDGRADGGAALASGVYLVRLEVDGRSTATRRATLLR